MYIFYVFFNLFFFALIFICYYYFLILMTVLNTNDLVTVHVRPAGTLAMHGFRTRIATRDPSWLIRPVLIKVQRL